MMVTLLEPWPPTCWLSPRPATLRIAVNADSLATWVIPALAATEGLFDLVIAIRVSQDWLKRGEVAAAITAHRPLRGCDAIPWEACYRATASPAYMTRWMPVTAASLAAAPTTFSDKDRLQRSG